MKKLIVQAKYLKINVSEYKKCIKKKVAEIPNLANPPDRTFIEKTNNPNNPMVAHLDMWWVEGVSHTNRWWGSYDATITIKTVYGELIQKITKIKTSPISQKFISINYENPFNFHFSDYNANGFLDMGLRIGTGGSIRNDPHWFWLWDDEISQFIRNYELGKWSNTASI